METYKTNTLTQLLRTLHCGKALIALLLSALMTALAGCTDTTTTLSSSHNPSQIGQTVTLKATVKTVPNASSPISGTTPLPVTNGTVTFRDTSTFPATVLGTASLDGSGTASFSAFSLSTGTRSLTATFNGYSVSNGGWGDPGYTETWTASTSAPLSQIVLPIGTMPVTALLSSSAVQSVFGQPVTLTATVTPVGPAIGTPSGFVTFTDASTSPPTVLGSVQLDANGSAGSSPVTTLSVGSHSITVAYSGDATFAASSGSLAQIVAQAATTTAVTSPANPFAGPGVPFTATVAPISPGAGTPTGTVTFTVDGAAQSPVPLVGGKATYVPSGLSLGSHAITAAYAGDANFAVSVSGTLNQTVDLGSSTTVLASSANPSFTGQTVVITATVAPGTGGGTPTGSVTFSVDGMAQTPITLTNGKAAYSIPNLSGGDHSITAAYSGDAAFAPSASGTLKQSVLSFQNVLVVTSSADDNGSISPDADGRVPTLRDAVTYADTLAALNSNVQLGITFDPTVFAIPQTITLTHGQLTLSANVTIAGPTAGVAVDGNQATRVLEIDAGTVSLTNLTVQNGYATSPVPVSGGVGGGGILIESGAAVSLTDCILTGNSTQGGGGLCSAGSVTLTDCTISSNSVTGGDGGGLSNSGTMTVIGCTIAGNYAPTFGGGVSSWGTLTMTNCTLTDNLSGDLGGALFNQGPATLTGCTFTGNSAGGGVWTTYSSSGGGALFNNMPSPTLTDCILYGDSGGEIVSPYGGTITATYCDIQGGYFGAGNISANPLLSDLGDNGGPTQTMALLPGSPCVGAGITVSGLDTDQRGAARRSPPDIGAFEATTLIPPVATQLSVSAPASATVGSPVTITVTALDASGNRISASTGTVHLTSTDPSAVLPADASLTNGVGQFLVTFKTTGAQTVTATDTSGLSGASGTVTVSKNVTTTAVASSAPQSNAGQGLTFTATVRSAGGTPTGSITFTLDGTDQAPIALSSGRATFNTSTLAIGSHTLKASYAGDSAFTSSSAALTQTVNKFATTTAIQPSLNPSAPGQAVTITATVTPTTGSGTPTGTITFTVDGAAQAPVALSSGQAAFSATALSLGSHTVTAAYTGDSAFAPSSGSFTQTVSADWTAVSLSVGGDNWQRALWNNADGTAALWLMTPQGQYVSQQQYGPYTGWTAQAISTGQDNSTRVLWTRTDNAVTLWLMNPQNNFLTQQNYGPYAGWTCKSISTAPDGTLRALWVHTDGAAALWRLDSQNRYIDQQNYGPYAGWTPKSLNVGPDGIERLLWVNGNIAAFWRLDSQNRYVDQQNYGPYAGFTATALVGAPNGLAHAIWTGTDGSITLWTLNSAGRYLGQQDYGPFGGWAEQSFAVGPDGDCHLLWDNLDGEAAFWRTNAQGQYIDQQNYGPY